MQTFVAMCSEMCSDYLWYWHMLISERLQTGKEVQSTGFSLSTLRWFSPTKLARDCQHTNLQGCPQTHTGTDWSLVCLR